MKEDVQLINLVFAMVIISLLYGARFLLTPSFICGAWGIYSSPSLDPVLAVPFCFVVAQFAAVLVRLTSIWCRRYRIGCY